MVRPVVQRFQIVSGYVRTLVGSQDVGTIIGIFLSRTEAVALSTVSLDVMALMKAIRVALIVHEQDKLWFWQLAEDDG